MHSPPLPPAPTLSDSAADISADRLHVQKIAALTGTICITGGLAVGPLVRSVLARYAPISE